MDVNELNNIIDTYKDFNVILDVRRYLLDEELRDMLYPYPIETINSIEINKDAFINITQYTTIHGIPLGDIVFCDIGHSDRTIRLETFIN